MLANYLRKSRFIDCQQRKLGVYIALKFLVNRQVSDWT
ncbi:hypothetical protein PRUB_b1059 [Pseudoalteromonas rubra]|uniref:Uncharacterized protein n=1 Tax=Pseudoalteromonas rubra TaxID=43658 RepID=A0A8T0C3A9_9GAMM|nr:hypothetical protein PRUB_b1059 [Pseudoalteromonas rubra]